jgi:RIO kinase 1
LTPYNLILFIFVAHYFLFFYCRFRHGYCKHNPRKMVRTWAEKELRNLLRLEAAGLPCPKPILLRSHVLLMTFIGDAGWPAPRLKVY